MFPILQIAHALKDFSDESPRISSIVELLLEIERTPAMKDVNKFIDLIDQAASKLDLVLKQAYLNRDKALVSLAHRALRLLTEIAPLNPEEKIHPDKQIILSTGQMLNLDELINFHYKREPTAELGETDNAKFLLNSETKDVIYPDDLRRIQQMAKEQGIEILNLVDEINEWKFSYYIISSAHKEGKLHLISQKLADIYQQLPNLVATLVADCGVRAGDICDADIDKLRTLATYKESEIIFLLAKLNVPFVDVIEMSSNNMMVLLAYQSAYIHLIRFVGISYSKLKIMHPDRLFLLLEKYQRVVELSAGHVNKKGYTTISPESLLATDVSILQLLLEDYESEELLKTFSMPGRLDFELFLTLDLPQQHEFLKNQSKYSQLIRNSCLSLLDVFDFDLSIREELLDNVGSIIKLTKIFDVTVEQFFNEITDIKMRFALYDMAHAIYSLMQKNPLSFEALQQFTSEDMLDFYSENTQAKWASMMTADKSMSFEERKAQVWLAMSQIVLTSERTLAWITKYNIDVVELLELPLYLIDKVVLHFPSLCLFIPSSISWHDFLKLEPTFIEQIVEERYDIKACVRNKEELLCVQQLINNKAVMSFKEFSKFKPALKNGLMQHARDAILLKKIARINVAELQRLDDDLCFEVFSKITAITKLVVDGKFFFWPLVRLQSELRTIFFNQTENLLSLAEALRVPCTKLVELGKEKIQLLLDNHTTVLKLSLKEQQSMYEDIKNMSYQALQLALLGERDTQTQFVKFDYQQQ